MAGDVKERLRRVMAEPCPPPAKITLPDELLYSELGLMIWNDLIFTPDFYQTHDEIAIFQEFGAEITERVRSGVTLIDLGAGDTRKVEHLLAAFEKKRVMVTYLALDISKSSLDHNISFLEKRHSREDSTVRCAGLWGTFEDGLQYVQSIKGPRLFLSLGSVLCNDPWNEALGKVKAWAAILRSEDRLLVGMDAHLVPRDSQKIWAAYHSRDDLYRRFFQNGFDYANRLVGETWFRDEDWEQLAELEYPTRHRFYFRARRNVQLGETGRLVLQGEELDWFDSHKYGQEDVELMFDKAGLVATDIWRAPNSEFRQYLVKQKERKDGEGDADSAVSGVS